MYRADVSIKDCIFGDSVNAIKLKVSRKHAGIHQ